MMPNQQYTVIAENDESEWSDQTGVLYHFPKRYLKFLEPGCKVIYYKGKMKNKLYASVRLTKEPHYFGFAEIDQVYKDPDSEKNDYFATIKDYQPFTKPVLAATGHKQYLEIIPSNKASNYWRDGVRPADKDFYNRIKEFAGNNVKLPVTQENDDKLDDREHQLESAVEGNKTQKFVTTYERDAGLRKQAIAIHGTTCIACGFNFEAAYGEYAKGYIHIHHVEPISEFGGEKKVDPQTDLVPLCANCHSVVHRRKDKTLSIEDLKALLNH